MAYFYELIISTVIFAFDTIGVVIVIIGGSKAVFAAFHKEVSKDKKTEKKRMNKLSQLRIDFGNTMVFALEYFLAADIIKLVLDPSWQELGKIAALIALRTALNFIIVKEIKMK
ncbi:DUF1622 domain-containing protein [Candidatus Peregrinibacteria bacterium]|nr:DUF1622 domain-containing protein [Candidatus Peregrinibacteria bacterium]